MRVLVLWSYHNIWPLFFGVNMFTIYNSAENVLRNPSYRIFMDISFATDMFTWTPPSRCFSTYKTWFLKIHPTFFHPTTFKSSEKETHYICHCPIFFWKTEPNFCCLPSSPQKNMNLVVKLGSLLVHYSPFFKVLLYWHKTYHFNFTFLFPK